MKKIFILFSILTLSACASMFSGTNENFIIRSEDDDTKLYFNSEYIGKGTGHITVSKKNIKNAIIRAEKKGCTPAIKRVETKIDPTTFLGCLIDFCVFTVLAVDWGATGAINEAIQTNYLITPTCD